MRELNTPKATPTGLLGYDGTGPGTVTPDAAQELLKYALDWIDVAPVSSNYTASVANERIPTDSSGGSFSITAPAALADGERFAVWRYSGSWVTDPVTILPGAGRTIDNGETELIADTDDVNLLIFTLAGTDLRLVQEAGFMPPASGVASVFGRSGAVVAASGDYTADQITQTATREFVTPAQKTKLDGIATGATANSSDAHLLSRTNHTGEQPIGSVTGLQGALDGKMPALSAPADANYFPQRNSGNTGLEYARRPFAVSVIRTAQAETDAKSGFLFPVGATITGVRAWTDGSAASTVKVGLNGTAITGASALSATTTQPGSDTAATAANVAAAGDNLTIGQSSVTGTGLLYVAITGYQHRV